jgi:hypothetical protein
MIEFMLSRLTMSICAILVLLTLAPVICTLPGPMEDSVLRSSLDQLASRFKEVANAPGKARLELSMSDYLEREGMHIILRPEGLWLVDNEVQEVQPLPEGFLIFVCCDGVDVRTEQAQLNWATTLTLSKSIASDDVFLEAHIENLEATSETASANLSMSFSLL